MTTADDVATLGTSPDSWAANADKATDRLSRSLVLPEVSLQAARRGGLFMSEYTLALAFDTDHAEFVRGFEAGRVWATAGGWAPLAHAGHEQTFTVHADNAEMMMRISEATGCAVAIRDIDDMWISVTFHPYQGDPA